MNIDDEIHKVELESIQLYRMRQQLEEQKIQIAQKIQQTEMRMIQLDGEFNVLNRMKESNG